MTKWADTFVNATGADIPLSSHTATGPDGGFSWVEYAYSSPGPTVVRANSVGYATPDTSGFYIDIAQVDPATSEHTVRLTMRFQNLNITNRGNGIAMSVDNGVDDGYIARVVPGLDKFQLFKQPGFQALDNVDLSLVADTDTVFALTKRINADGTTVEFLLSVDGTPMTWVNSGTLVASHANGKTAIARCGLNCQDNQLGTSFEFRHWELEDIASGDNVTIDNANLPDKRPWAVDNAANTRNMVFSGTYTGTPTAIEYRIVDAVANTPIAGHDWQTIDGSPSNGTWSGTATAVPAQNATANDYRVEVRFSNQTGITEAGSTTWGIGRLFLVLGESPGARMFEDHRGTGPALSVNATYYNGQNSNQSTPTVGTWAPCDGRGSRELANNLSTALGIRIGLIKYSPSQSPLLQDATNSGGGGGSDFWLNVGGAGPYNAVRTIVNTTLGGDAISGVLWMQVGASDAFWLSASPTLYADYFNGMQSLRANIATDFTPHPGASSIPLMANGYGQDSRGGGTQATDSSVDAVRRALGDYCATQSDCEDVPSITLATTDGVHYDSTGYGQLGRWLSEGMASLLGISNNFVVPRMQSAVEVDATNVDVTLTGLTDMTPTTNISGFEVEQGAWVTGTGARQSASVVRVTHASGTQTDLRVGYGLTPNVTTYLFSSGPATEPYPLRPANVVPGVTIGRITTAPQVYIDGSGNVVGGTQNLTVTWDVFDATTGNEVATKLVVAQQGDGTWIIDSPSIVSGVDYIIKGHVAGTVGNRWTGGGTYTATLAP